MKAIGVWFPRTVAMPLLLLFFRPYEMNNNNCWRVPIPTDIRQNESIDTLSRMIFLDIIHGCQNKDYHVVYYHGNKRIDLNLKKGQYLFVVKKYADGIKIDRRVIERCLKVINERYTELLIEKKAFGLIITVKDYDEITRMQNEMLVEVSNERNSNAIRTQFESKSKNKSDKNIQNEKTVKNTQPDSEPKDSLPVKSVEVLKDSRLIGKLKGKFPEIDVNFEMEVAYNWLISKGKIYKNYEMFMNNWLLRRQKENQMSASQNDLDYKRL
jgi:hypothetical protein